MARGEAEGSGIVYECPRCDYETRLFLADRPDTRCPECETGGSSKLGELFFGTEEQDVDLSPRLRRKDE